MFSLFKTFPVILREQRAQCQGQFKNQKYCFNFIYLFSTVIVNDLIQLCSTPLCNNTKHLDLFSVFG